MRWVVMYEMDGRKVRIEFDRLEDANLELTWAELNGAKGLRLVMVD